MQLSPLAEELQLSSDQNEKMRQIWESVRADVDACFVRAQEAQKKRDEALLSLLTNEQKIGFAAAQAQCAREMLTLKTQRDAAFKEAVKRTEQLLTEQQRQRYQTILQSRLGQPGANDEPDWLSPPAPASMPSR